MGFIYALIDPRDGATRYVGQTNYPNPRFRLYQHHGQDGPSPVKRWNQKLRSLGLKSEMVILEETADVDSGECKWIGLYRAAGCRLLNLRGGGTHGDWPVAKGNKGRDNLAMGRAIQLQKRREKESAPLCPKGLHEFPTYLSIQGERRILVCLGCRRAEVRTPIEELLPVPEKRCMVNGCERSFYGVPGKRGQRYVDSPGYCGMHYQRWRKAELRGESSDLDAIARGFPVGGYRRWNG